MRHRTTFLTAALLALVWALLPAASPASAASAAIPGRSSIGRGGDALPYGHRGPAPARTSRPAPLGALHAPGVGRAAATLSGGELLMGTGNSTLYRFDASGNLESTSTAGITTPESPGLCLNVGNSIYQTDWGAGTVSEYDWSAEPLAPNWASTTAYPLSCDTSQGGTVYEGDWETGVLSEWTPGGALITQLDLPYPANWVRLAPDDCTLYYTSYTPAVHRFDVCTSVPMSDFADSLPTDNSSGYCYQPELLPDGGLLVPCGYYGQVDELDASGAVVAEFSSLVGGAATETVAVSADGQSFWVDGYQSGVLEQVSLSSGSVLTSETVPINNVAGGLRVVPASDPPTVLSAPLQSIAYPSTLGGNPSDSLTIDVGWSAQAGSAPVCSEQLERAIGGGAWTSVSLPSATAQTTTDVIPAVRDQVVYRLEVTDCDGLDSGWVQGQPFTYNLAQENSSRWTYSGSWSSESCVNCAGGYAEETTQPGASATFTSGLVWSLGLLLVTGPGRGSVEVYLDTRVAERINLSSRGVGYRRIVLATSSPTLAVHVIRVVDEGSGANARVDLDGVAAV